MDLGLGPVLDAFDRLPAGGAAVLATVIETGGSTYRKPGAMMLIEANGQTHGLLSGGCLEADLAAHAAGVVNSGQPKTVSYDMLSGDEMPWDLGLGCRGLVRVLLIRLAAAHPVFTRLVQMQAAGQRALLMLVCGSELDWLPAGTLLLPDSGDRWPGLPDHPEAGRIKAAVPDKRPRRSELLALDTSRGQARMLLVPINPPRRLLLLGAGPDAAPLVELAECIGWQVDVADHRPAYIERIADRVTTGQALTLRPEDLDKTRLLAAADAAVVMSHHLDTDRGWMAQVVKHPVAYIGLLGPAERRRNVLEDIPAEHQRRVHGPAGLDIGAELPETIALSILAEAHAVLKHRSGGALSEKEMETQPDHG